ncbi:MAG: type IV pilus twitching motility protein PilT [Candidatus Xenobia bacterium]
MATLEAYLQEVLSRGGSDLHIAAGSPPLMRFQGVLTPLSQTPLSSDQTHELLLPALSDEQQSELETRKNIDFAYEIETLEGLQRFRGNCYWQRLGLDGVFRMIPNRIPTLGDLGMPTETLQRLVQHHQGIILVTGPSGSGKTTTLAALINVINETKAAHIITIEDPIEYIHPIKHSLINQRQLIRHTRSFAAALRAAVREDPDVILVGELRDLETISLAITAAETGHLVLATLHTSSAGKTIDRLVGAFPATQQAQIRTMLAESLRGVVSQVLLPAVDGPYRVAAVEILLGCLPVANLIRDGKTFQIPSVMQTGKQLGMRSMDEALLDLLQQRKISPQDAYDFATDKKVFERG